MACVVAFGLVLLVVLGLAARDLLRIRDDLEAGKSALSDLRLEDVEASGGIDELTRSVERHLQQAEDTADNSPWLQILGRVPKVRTQLNALRDLTDELAAVGAIASESGATIDAALEGAGTPAGRIALLGVAADQLQRLEQGLAALDTEPPSGLAAPLRDAYVTLDDAVTSAEAKLADGRRLLSAAVSILTGPTRYLVLAGNNAEMTAGSGMPLSVGVAEINAGEIALREFVQSSDLVLPEDQWVPAPGDLGLLYAPMGLGGDFRGTTATPNFPTVAPIFQQMAERAGLGRVDGVLLIDAVTLGELIELTGPVEVEGLTFSHENLVEELLYENYRRFGVIDPNVREARANLQSQIAEAIFDALTTRDVPLVEFVGRLADLAAGRHLLAWSPVPEVQEVWETVGATGELLEAGLMISVENYDGNKLDWFLRPKATIDVRVTPNGDWRAQLEVSITNPELDPEEVGSVVLGVTPEVHFVFLDVHLPKKAYDITTTSEGGFRGRGLDPPMQARTMIYPIRQGETVTKLIEFTLPRDVVGTVLLPSARVEPIPVTVDGTTVTDAVPVPIFWAAAFPPPPDDSAPGPVRIAVVAANLALLVAAASTVRLVRRPEEDRAGPVAVAEVGALACLAALVVAAVLAVLV